MIIASVNGAYGQGFLETVEREDGTVRRTGMLKVGGPDALRLRRLVANHEPLVYSGPVLVDGRWCAGSFPIVATSIVTEPGTPLIVSIMLRDDCAEAAA
jgi:hypothetical protein